MLRSKARAVTWYLRTHGFRHFAQRLWSEVVTRINNKEFVYLVDLTEALQEADHGEELTIEAHSGRQSLSKGDMAQLESRKAKDALTSFLARNFSRGATLWLVKRGEKIVGLQWTLVGGFGGFYSLPVSQREVIILAVEVFPDFRGKGYWPRIAELTFSELRRKGFTRVYLKTHVSNHSMQASMRKVNCRTVGLVRTFSVAGKHVTIWDSRSLWRS
jgi:RimJ/RimL family protein N-acetyltransferase